MKNNIARRTDDELIGYPIKDVKDGWFFRIEELSPNHFRVTGIDRWGRAVTRDGIDPDKLIEECKKDIDEILPKD